MKRMKLVGSLTLIFEKVWNKTELKCISFGGTQAVGALVSETAVQTGVGGKSDFCGKGALMIYTLLEHKLLKEGSLWGLVCGRSRTLNLIATALQRSKFM